MPLTASDEQQFLQAFLAERDQPCPACGYNLRNLPSSRCPECGEELRVTIGFVEPRQAAVLTGLIGLASGLGLSGLLLFYATIMIIREWRFRSFAAHFIVINGIGFLLFAGLMGLWLWKWRRIRRLSPAVRRLLAAGCWVVALLWAVVFSFAIR